MFNRTILTVFLIFCSRASVVVLGGGQVTINGAVTATQIDFYINFTANANWLAVIWSPDQTDADVTLLQIDSANTARPVIATDCYLDQNSYIQKDDVNNLQPSVTSFAGDISTGISMAINRNIATGDSQDITIYPNQVIQLCFIYSTQPFVGKGYQKANQKACSFISLHSNVDYWQDRLLGNYAATALFGGGNLTVYATESTDDYSGQSWLFLSVVHKAQGLSLFAGKWIGVTYANSTTNADMGLITYDRVNNLLKIQITDMFIANSSYSARDESYQLSQGGQDLVQVMGGYDSISYMAASYKRKFVTGDLNRDSIIQNGINTFCFIYGNAPGYSAFVQSQRHCLTINLQTGYSSYFRQNSQGDGSLIIYVEPKNNVRVITKGQDTLAYFGLGLLYLLLAVID